MEKIFNKKTIKILITAFIALTGKCIFSEINKRTYIKNVIM